MKFINAVGISEKESNRDRLVVLNGGGRICANA